MKSSGHCQESGRVWIGLLAGLGVSGLMFVQGFAQTGEVSSSASGASGILAEFLQAQQELVQELQALISQGATEAQIEAWQQENAPAFEAEFQLAQAIAIASALQPLPIADWVNFPADATTNLEDFLTTGATLSNAFAQIHNQLLQTMPSAVTQEDLRSMREQEEESFRDQNAGDLQLHERLAHAVAAESASMPFPIPGPPLIPPNATPQLQAYLVARNAIANAQAQLLNQYLNADPAVTRAAMEQWARQNAGSLQQLDQLAQDLANSTAEQQGNDQ